MIIRSTSVPFPKGVVDDAVYDALAVGDTDVPANKAQQRFLRDLAERALDIAVARAAGTEPNGNDYDPSGAAERLRREAGGAAVAPCADPCHAEVLKAVLAGGEPSLEEFVHSDFIGELCRRLLENYSFEDGAALGARFVQYVAERLPKSDRLVMVDEYGDPARMVKTSLVKLKGEFVDIDGFLFNPSSITQVVVGGEGFKIFAIGNDLPCGAGTVFDSYRELPLTFLFLKDVP